MRVLVEIAKANREGASADNIHELFQHARELLDIMEVSFLPPLRNGTTNSAAISRAVWPRAANQRPQCQ